MIGQTLGSFRIVAELGHGGMGVIYQGEHAMIGKRVAIKVLRPELSSDREVVGRFFNEAKAASVIDHPGLVDVYDFGYTTDGRAYIVMELLAGESLGARLQRERVLPTDLAIALVRQLCGLLGAVHAQRIVHRDLKPDNIYLTPDPDVARGIRARVLDFGIAKLAPGIGALGGPETRTGILLGTPLYMAPEQCRGAGEVDHRADIYALGVILFEMVCGDVPFSGVGLGEVIAKHQYVAPPVPRTLAPSIPPALEALILRMLAKSPDERPQSMAEVLAALDERAATAERTATAAGIQSTSGGNAAAPAAPTPVGVARRRPRRAALYAGVAVALLGAATVTGFALHHAAPAADPRLAQLALLPPRTACVIGLDGTRLFKTAIWRAVGGQFLAAITRENDHVLDKLRASCDLDPVRDLRWGIYAFDTSATRADEGAFVIDGNWDRDKLQRCITQLSPDVAASPQPPELSGGPIRDFAGVFVAWIAPHTAAIAVDHRGLTFLRELTEHAPSTDEHASLQRTLASVDRDAVLWIAAAAPNGLPRDVDPFGVLERATAASVSIAFDAELDAHAAVTSPPGHASELEQQLARQLEQARAQTPMADAVHLVVRGDVLAIDAHLDAVNLRDLAARILRR